MARTSDVEFVATQEAVIDSTPGGPAPYRQLLDDLRARLPVDEVAALSTLPRGGLQLVQPQSLPETLTRGYARDFATFDRLSWEALTRGEPVRGSTCWPGGDPAASRFVSGLLQPHGLLYSAAVPLRSPVLEGYPGVLVALRNPGSGDFTDQDLEALRQFAAHLDDARRQTVGARSQEGWKQPLPHRLPLSHLVFDSELRARMGQAELAAFDVPLRNAIVSRVRHEMEHVNGQEITSDRISFADSHGDFWNFRIVKYRQFPALGDGPFIFVCLQPECSDWSVMRPGDFAADNEVARLVPAMQFMIESFSRGPTLAEVAKAVHLSPFHFHRRFTELLGITPKHFLLDCQIAKAKQLLAERQKPLAEIASTCGFAHQSHFTSRFKQATGLTPTRWRRLAVEPGSGNGSAAGTNDANANAAPVAAGEQ